MMLCAYSNPNEQTLAPGAAAVFTIEVPCRRGYVNPRLSAGTFLLAGGPAPRRRCPCMNNGVRGYHVDVKGDIAIATGGTAGEISMALALDGTAIPASGMSVTPAAVEEYFNISGAMVADVFRGCCESLTFINTSDQPITLKNLYIEFGLPELDRR